MIGQIKKQLFADILEKKNRFSISVERLTLKRATNNEVLHHIKTILLLKNDAKKILKIKSRTRTCYEKDKVQSQSPLDILMI